MWACDPDLTAEIVSSYHAVGPLVAQALTAFLVAQCALVGDHLWPADATQAVLRDPNYDFIVVGAGSAGSVVANRLSEVHDWKVLLIEAGGNPTLATEIPQTFFNNIKSPEEWGYKTQPQERACRSYKTGGCTWPRAKVLGGCSSTNAMFYVRGNKADYDEWAADGNKGWSYAEVLPYFKKIENVSHLLTEEDKVYHNQDGYLSVDYSSDADDFEMLMIQANTELGIKYSKDVNGADQMGVTKSATTIKDGVRQSTARAYLSPIKDRNNLHVIKNAHVTKILFKPNTNVISGVIVNKNGEDFTISAKKEVIISAGAINTPQLLLLSGIGPRKHLENLNIEVKADLPVGENLQDHLYVPIYYKFPGDKNMYSLPNVIGAFGQYILERKGPLISTAPYRVISFINTTDSQASIPDIAIHHILLPPSIHNFVDIYNLHGANEEFLHKFHELNNDNFILVIAATVLKPKSRGKILLQDQNPFTHPLIYANYFEHPDDLETVFRAIKQHILKYAQTESFKAANLELQWLELEPCKNIDKNTDEFLRCWAREITNTLYHPTSSVKMGADDDETAVVDSDLRVKKVNRLRVIDASIMPTVVRGNTNAPTIMIAEKGADLIKKTWLGIHTEL